MADVSQLSRLTKKADAVSLSASRLVARAIRELRGELANLSGELNLAGNADDREKAYETIRKRMKRLSRRLDVLLEGQQQLAAKGAAKSAATLTGLEVKYSPSRAKAICELVTPAQGENLAAVFTDRMGRNLINTLREATVATLREQAVSGGTLKETARRMAERWQTAMKNERPVFVDSGGHSWNTETYFQMNVRTNTMRVYNDCLADNVARATGSDLMRISTGGSDPNCECAAWEGCIVSLTGKTHGFPTYEDARKGGCFHPNCVHTLEAVDETADADEIALQKSVPAQADMASDWEAQDERKYEIDRARKMRDEGLTQEQARVAVDRDNLAASIRSGLIRGDADEIVRKMSDAQVTALCPNGNPPEFLPTKKATKADPHAADEKWNHGKWGGVVHIAKDASADHILEVCKVADAGPAEPPAPPSNPTPSNPNGPVDFDSLPAEQRRALEWYVSGEGQYVNQAMRGNVGADFGELTQEEKASIAAMQAATNHPLADNIATLYRSVDARAVFGDISQGQYNTLCDYFRSTSADRRFYERQLGDLITRTNGKELVEKGFMSTTRDRNIALDWGGFTGSDRPITLELKVSPGVKGIDLRKLDAADMPQKEVLLHPGVKYRVLEISHVDGVPYVKAEIVTGSAKASQPAPKEAPQPKVKDEKTAWKPSTELERATDEIMQSIGARHSDKPLDKMAANPGYSKGDFKHTSNCGRCCDAFEMRARGYDVVAKGTAGNAKLSSTGDWMQYGNSLGGGGWCGMYEGAAGIKIGSRPYPIQQKMAEWGNGARAKVFVQWRGGGGHFFVAEQIGNKTVFKCPQSGKIYDDEVWRHVKRSPFNAFLRTDNLTPNQKILECVQLTSEPKK